MEKISNSKFTKLNAKQKQNIRGGGEPTKYISSKTGWLVIDDGYIIIDMRPSATSETAHDSN